MALYQPQVKVNITGTMIITNSNMQFFYFSLADLASSESNMRGFEVNGIEMIPCISENESATDWINFNTPKGRVAYLKFSEASDEEVAKLQLLFIHLRASMMNIIPG
jgi:hypothetical protein